MASTPKSDRHGPARPRAALEPRTQNEGTAWPLPQRFTVSQVQRLSALLGQGSLGKLDENYSRIRKLQCLNSNTEETYSNYYT